MTLRGYIKDGIVVLNNPTALPNGTEVDVQPSASIAGKGSRAKPRKTAARPSAKRAKAVNKKSAGPAKRKPKRAGTLAEQLRPFIGSVKGMPADLAANHDHYIHGPRKRT